MTTENTNSWVKWTVATTIIFILSMNAYFMYTYFLLHSSNPLENFRGEFITPISLSEDATLVGSGTYDRDVMCKLTNFDIHLLNPETLDELVIGPRSLAKAPPVNIRPGKNIPIEFEVFVPNTLYVGTWKPTFHGEYLCQAGIFQAPKSVSLQLSSVLVLP